MQFTKLSVLAIIAYFGATAFGQDIEQTLGRRPACPPNCPPVAPCPPGDVSPLNPANPGPDAGQQNQSNPFNDAMASAGESGTQPTASYNPAFFGDLMGEFGTKMVDGRLVFAPINSHSGGFKIADYESPMPMDRVYYAYNDFGSVFSSSNGSSAAPINLERHVIGLEKTFFDGFMSLGARIPFVVTNGDPQVSTEQLADITLIMKMVLWGDLQKGNVVSLGCALTLPTGPQEVLTRPDYTQITLVDFLCQPYLGWVFNLSPRLYTQGFFAASLPSDTRDVTLLFNDFGFGYWLYKNTNSSFIQGFVPTVEFHLNSPFDHGGKASLPIGYSELADVTLGTNVVLPRATLGIAVGLPMTGPTPFSVEGVVNFTLRF
jgi:hypothetical protein